MPKKLTYRYVKEQIEFEDGFKLLSTKYINALSKLKLVCPIGHEFYMRYNDFKKGRRCPVCAGNKKLTIEYIKEQVLIIASNYELLSTEYIGAKSKLKFKCDKGHTFKMNWDNFKRGIRCPICAGNIKYNIKFIRKKVFEEGYELLSTEYIDSLKKLEFRCNKGHIFKMRWNNFNLGHRCPKCFYESISGKNNYRWKNYTLEELNELDKYKSYIIKLSNRNYNKYKDIINPNNLYRSKYKYHLDHIFTIMEGFRRSIPVKYIANPNNLQMLWWKKNIIKSDKNWQSEKKLYQGYAKFKNLEI